MVNTLWAIFFLTLPVVSLTARDVPELSWSGHTWIVEQSKGGSVFVDHGKLEIADEAGATIWLNEKLSSPLHLRYQVRAISDRRVSDLNCFWMAHDPRHPDRIVDPRAPRSGAFADYDTLATYYVGYGGNDNSTTRFRRYDGAGHKPLLPAFDHRAKSEMLVADHLYTIDILVDSRGTEYRRDGETLFRYEDPVPLTSGWFGFRTVNSHLEILNFEMRRD